MDNDAFHSHKWLTITSSTSDGIERTTFCADCGCEYMGDPAEFPELIYPACGEDAP